MDAANGIHEAQVSIKFMEVSIMEAFSFIVRDIKNKSRIYGNWDRVVVFH